MVCCVLLPGGEENEKIEKFFQEKGIEYSIPEAQRTGETVVLAKDRALYGYESIADYFS